MARRLYKEYEIPEEHASFMRTMCRIAEGDALPDKVRRRYIFVRWHADSVNLTLSQQDLLMVVVTSNYRTTVPDPEPDDIVTAFLHGDVSEGTPVICNWRNGKRRAVMVGASPDRKAIVRFEGEPDERTMTPSDVVVAEELPATT